MFYNLQSKLFLVRTVFGLLLLLFIIIALGVLWKMNLW